MQIKTTHAILATAVTEALPHLPLVETLEDRRLMSTYAVTSTDNCSTPVVVCVPPSGSTFPLGTTTVNCTATEASGNNAPGSFPVRVGERQHPVVL